MTAALFNQAGGNFANVVDGYVYPQFIGYAMRAPSTQDVYPAGTRWQDNSVNPAIIYQTTGGGIWYSDASASGSFTTLVVTPGPVSLTGTTSINTSGAAVTSINTGGTGALNLGNATGNTAVTGSLTSSAALSANNISSTTTIAAGTSVTAGTTVTATLGNITATNGNIVRGTAGNKDVYSSVATTTAAGANSAGTVTLVNGTATIATTAVTANSQIRLYRQGIGATGANALGFLTITTKTAGVSFVIASVTPGAATAPQTTDVSIVAWEIVN